jgi:hypothetical protein
MGDDHRSPNGAATTSSSGGLRPQRGSAGSRLLDSDAAEPKRRLEPNTLEGFKDWLYDLLEQPVGELGCAGPPECAACPGGVHDTGLGTFSGVIEVMIDDQEYELRVTKKHKGA